MEFWTGGNGVFRLRATPASLADSYRGYVEAAKVADELGFDAYGAPEHHFMYDGFMPIPLQALAAAAAATKRIRLVTGAMLLPLYTPEEAAAYATTLDVLSGGRVQPGFGMGYRPYEFDGLGTEKRTRGARLSEGIRAFDALTGGWSFVGQHYDTRAMALATRPVQRPIPNFFCGGTSIVAARRAGRHGHKYWLANANFDRIKMIAEEYWRVAGEAGVDREHLGLAAFKDVCIGDTVEEAQFIRDALVENFYEEHIIGYGYLVGPDGQHIYDLKPSDPLFQEFVSSIFCGTPEMVVEELKKYEELGLDAVHIETTQKELLAEEVIPHFR